MTRNLAGIVLIVAVRILAALFLFIASIGIMLIYGIVAIALFLVSRVRSLGMKQTANQDMRQRSDDNIE